MNNKVLTVLFGIVLTICCCLGFGCTNTTPITSESESIEPETAEITFIEGEGYTYSLSDGEVEIGTTIEFSITLDENYNQSVVIVKANGTEIVPNDEVYSLIISVDTVIEVFGVVENPLEEIDFVEVARNPFGLSGTETVEDLGSKFSSVTTVATTKWSASGAKFAEISVSKYSEIRFFVKSTGYFELYTTDQATTFYQGQPTTWTEVRFVQGETSWTVYVNDEEKGTIVLTNLKDDFFIQLGDNTVSISELLGVLDTNNA